MSVFFVVTDVYALFEIPSKKKRSQLYKIGVVGGWGVQRPFIKFIKKIPSVTGERLLLLAFQIFPLAWCYLGNAQMNMDFDSVVLPLSCLSMTGI